MNGHAKPPNNDASANENVKTVPLRILCVEDNDGDYHLITEHLNEAEFDVPPQIDRAVRLEDAICMLHGTNDTVPYDLVILDLSLPDCNGPETYHRVRDAAPLTAITILSGNNDRQFALKMVHSGAQDFLPKDSINGESLLRSILYAVERQRHRTEMHQLNQRLQRAKSDLETAQMQLIQAEKLESLGRLAAGVAHEVKNPLGILQMGVDYLSSKRRDTLTDNERMVLANMQTAVSRADAIIHGMLDYSRADEFQLKPSCMNDLVERAIGLVHHELVKKNIDIKKELTDPLPLVMADRAKLEQVVINLLTNAIDVTPAGEPLKVRTRWGRIEDAKHDQGSRQMERLRCGDDVVIIEVRDHGPGIPEELFTRIFEPFYTTKPTGEGTGLGLSVARRIVQLHHGHIEVRNVWNPVGLRVRIILKACETSQSATSPIPIPLPISGIWSNAENIP